MAGHPDVRLGIDPPDGVPHLVGLIEALAEADAGVGAKQVDGAEAAFGVVDQIDQLGLDAHIDLAGGGPGYANALGHGCGAVAVQIRHHHLARSFSGEPLAHRFADAARTAGDDDGLVLNFHEDSPDKDTHIRRISSSIL